jgi:hypothetical protein
MAYVQKFLTADNTTLANWTSWGQGISTWMSTAGFTKTDNNVTWATTAAPSASAFVYEVWQCQDTLNSTFPYYVKIEYGTSSSNSCPTLRISVGTGPSTAGVLSGNIIGPYILQVGNTTAETAGNTFECNFCGNSGGYLGIMMWRNAANANRPCFFGLERSQNSSGVYSGSYVTVVTAGYNSANTVTQQTLFAPATAITAVSSTVFATLCASAASLLTLNTTPFLPICPLVGLADNMLTVAGVAKTGDQTEGATSNATMYGNTTPYIYTKTTNFISIGFTNNNGLLMRAN